MQTSAAVPAVNTRVWATSHRLPALTVLLFGLVVVYAVSRPCRTLTMPPMTRGMPLAFPATESGREPVP